MVETGAATALGPQPTHNSPTDLLAIALVSCSLVTMSQAAEKAGISIDGSVANFNKKMGSSPRRIVAVSAEFEIHGRPNTDQIVAIEMAAVECPVHKSLSQDLLITYKFKYI